MLLIAGLGNPKKIYAKTWHNIGFLVVEALAKRLQPDIENFRFDNNSNAERALGNISGQKIILAKPQSYMNLSGESIQKLCHYYKIAAGRVWLVHDDVDLELGSLRVSEGSSSGGHNGVESVIQMLNSKKMVRFRVGISTKDRQTIPTEKYVLMKIPLKKRGEVKKMIQYTADSIFYAIENGIPKTANTYNKK